MATTAPYGSWASPISVELVSSAGVTLDDLVVDGDAVLWLERRPLEGGRQVLCRRLPGGDPHDVTGPGFNVRTRVHEYGGGAHAAHHGTVFFSNYTDQRMYRQDPGEPPRPITPDSGQPSPSPRYADARLTPDGAWIVCVRESHDGRKVSNELVVLPSDGTAAPRVLASGRDFYASPRLDPSGRRLAWLEWDHPRMPWDGTELMVAGLDPAAAAVTAPALVAGGARESVFQPEWSPEGVLHFVSDRSGWWNLYRDGGGEAEALAPMDAEVGVPQWVFGLSTYAFLPGGRIALLYGRGPVWRLGLLEPGAGRPDPLELPFTSFYPPRLRSLMGGQLATFAASSTEPTALVLVDPGSGAVEVVRRGQELDLDPAYLSVPRPVELPTEGGQTAHALYYPPANPEFEAPRGELPPLLVTSHGGPTDQVVDRLSLSVQFFTSRGFAVADVDYGGSTGYGREYRERLNGNWGVVDTLDCVNAARQLAAAGEVDGARLAIRGGSAGGYTTLCALTFHDAFTCGASYYGVADVEALARDTHKFESRYLDGLIGPYPETAERYRQRSPIHHTDQLSCPVILLQGREDPVVPPDQAEQMARALDAKGIPYALLIFEGEQHGLRRAETVRRALGAELYFYSRIFGFDPADQIDAVLIHNL